MAGKLEIPFPFDLRAHTPPLGYRPEEVPVVDIAGVDLEAHRIHKGDGTFSDVFAIPGEPGYLLREQLVDTRIPAVLKGQIEAGNNSFAWFENEGVHIPSHRHIGGKLAHTLAGGRPEEGYLFTLCKRLPDAYVTLDPQDPAHTAGSLSVLRTAHKYINAALNDPKMSGDMLDDCFSANQFSISPATGSVALHDTAIYSENVRECIKSGEDWVIERCVGMLDIFAAAAVQGARGTPFARAALLVREQIRSDLPSPDYSGEDYVPPALEEQRRY